MPQYTPHKYDSPSNGKMYVAFLFQMQGVGDLLVRVWKDEAGKSNEELVFRSLAALHTALVDRPTEPCPALAAVLHLVDPYLIPKSVRAILQAKRDHFCTLRTLCDWLLWWPRATCLSPWVLALIDGLEAERQLDVLMEVTLATVEGLFLAVMLPAVRPGVIDVVWRMLASSRHSPQVFHKVLLYGDVMILILLHLASCWSFYQITVVPSLLYASCCVTVRGII
jgi:hypothetical protein